MINNIIVLGVSNNTIGKTFRTKGRNLNKSHYTEPDVPIKNAPYEQHAIPIIIYNTPSLLPLPALQIEIPRQQ